MSDQHTVKPATKRMDTKKLVMLAMFAAIAFLLMWVSKLLPPLALGFLDYDPKDIIIVISGFLYGPLSAVLISVTVSLLEMVAVSTTGPIGCIMNVLSTCAFVCPAALFYKRRQSLSGAAVGLGIGVLMMTAVMLLWNYLITPLYMNVPRETVEGLLLPVFLPFNLIKGGLNAAITMLVYKPIVQSLRKAHLVPASSGAGGGAKVSVTLISLFVLATFILFALMLMGVI